MCYRLPFLPLLFIALLAIGCQGESSTTETPPVPKDNPDAVAKLKSSGAALTLDEATGNVVGVDFRGTDPDGSDLLALKGLVAVKRLNLADCTGIMPGDIAEIAKSPSIEVLDLRNCELDDDSLIALLPLKKLRALWLSDEKHLTNVSVDSMATLAQFENLEVLGLDYLWVTEEWLEQLTGLTKLRELYLSKTLVDDTAMAEIVKFPLLEKLRISKVNNVTDEGLALLTQLPNLKYLDVSEVTTISNVGMESLGKMTQLEWLNLWLTLIDDQGIAHLDGLVNLTWLNLDHTGLSDAGMPALAGMTQLEFLHIGSTAITDESLQYLEGMTNLKDLKVSRTGITAEGAVELQKTLPNVDIDLEYHPGG